MYYNHMRSIINISLPEGLAKLVKKEVRSGNFASTSDFFRHLLRLWNTNKLAKEFKSMTKDLEAGKGIVLRSLKDLDD